jgi:F0F1-type ATP synthase membrane subunit b/b'
MGGLSLLQVFLVINVFIVGALSVLAVQYALAHYRPKPAEADKPKPLVPEIRLSASAKQRLLQAAQADIQAVMERSTADLQHDLKLTTNKLNQAISMIGTEIVGNEMERYRLQLEAVRKQAESALHGAQDDIQKHQDQLKATVEEERAALRAKLREEVEAEKQRKVAEIQTAKDELLRRMDTRLADAVASFLVDTLGHDVDLGAQNKYLLAMLEEHKDDLKRELNNGA